MARHIKKTCLHAAVAVACDERSMCSRRNRTGTKTVWPEAVCWLATSSSTNSRNTAGKHRTVVSLPPRPARLPSTSEKNKKFLHSTLLSRHGVHFCTPKVCIDSCHHSSALDVTECTLIFPILSIRSNVRCYNYFVHVLFEVLHLCGYNIASRRKTKFPVWD